MTDFENQCMKEFISSNLAISIYKTCLNEWKNLKKQVNQRTALGDLQKLFGQSDKIVIEVDENMKRTIEIICGDFKESIDMIVEKALLSLYSNVVLFEDRTGNNSFVMNNRREILRLLYNDICFTISTKVTLNKLKTLTPSDEIVLDDINTVEDVPQDDNQSSISGKKSKDSDEFVNMEDPPLIERVYKISK